ncbi:MAG: NUDIX hydrolase [Patescibacteria group bacterium]|nr:NUDIX hydrolase [Patescibacteria group bacterium]
MSDKKIVQKIVLGGAIFNKNKKLILQRHKNENIFPNMWELPSGKREPLEDSYNSLLREMKEETGLEVEIIMPCSIFDYQIENEQEIRDSTQINFLLKPTGSVKIKLSNEHQKFAWINCSELEKFALSRSTKNVIKKAFKLIQIVKL